MIVNIGFTNLCAYQHEEEGIEAPFKEPHVCDTGEMTNFTDLYDLYHNNLSIALSNNIREIKEGICHNTKRQ